MSLNMSTIILLYIDRGIFNTRKCCKVFIDELLQAHTNKTNRGRLKDLMRIGTMIVPFEDCLEGMGLCDSMFRFLRNSLNAS